MPLRSSRATAQSLSHIWISDEILAEAFNRFVRVSHTHTSRRYGSNVPGPLEARRRQAKRRMGLAAHAASGSVGMGDSGALFAFGPPRVDWEKEWTWQAPSYEHPLIGAKPPAPIATGSWARSLGLAQQSQGRREVRHVDVDQTAPCRPSLISTSANAFHELLLARADETSFTADNLKPMLDFLQSSADEALAQNLLKLAEWLSCRSLTDDALRSLLDVVRSKIQLETLPGLTPTANVISLLLQHENASKIATCFTHTLDALPDASMRKAITLVTRALELRSSKLPHAAWRDLARLWLRVLSACVHMRGEHSQSSKWSFIYYQLADRIPISDLHEHFATLSRPDFVRVLLRYWVPKYMHGGHANNKTSFVTISASQYKLQMLQAEESGKSQAIIDDFEARRTERDDAGEWHGGVAHDTSLADMFVVLHNHNMPYVQLLDDTFAVLTASEHPLTVWRLFRDTFTKHKLGIGEETAIDLIHYFLETGNREDVRRAFWIFDRVKTISATQCAKLPIDLISHGFGTPDRIFAILNRRNLHDTVPVGQRSMYTLAFNNAHSDLVELVAFTYAKSLLISSRVAFRRVWECFRFQQDRGAPLSALMSRAMVRAGIARAMQYDNRYIARSQIKYIISVVHRIEGEEEASKLDRMIFNIKKTRFFDPNGEEMMARRMRTARTAEANLASRARWRLRRWTRKQSSPWFSMRGVEDGMWRAEDQGREQSDDEHPLEHTQTQSFAEPRQTAQDDMFVELAADDEDLTALREKIDISVQRENDCETVVSEASSDAYHDDDLAHPSPDGLSRGTDQEVFTPGLGSGPSMPARHTAVEAGEKTEESFVAFRPFTPSVA